MNDLILTTYLHALDELNLLTSTNYAMYGDTELRNRIAQMIDTVLSVLIKAYTMGLQATAEMLSFDLQVDVERMRAAIYQIIDGKTFEDRVAEWVIADNLNMLNNLVESEFHRVYCQAELDGAVMVSSNLGLGVIKTWFTVNDDKVRETHRYLEGESVAVDEEFFTFDGDHAPCPGGFEKAKNNAGCRCVLSMSYDILQE